MGDPTSRALGALRPDAAFGNVRSSRLVDRLNSLGGPVTRSRDPHEVERPLPALLAAQPGPDAARTLRATARLHAAIGQVEIAVVTEGHHLRAALLSLVEGADRQPWVSCGEPGAVGREMGAPTSSLRLAGGWFNRPVAPR